MSVASEPSLAVGPTTAQVAPAPPVPVFSVWDSTGGETADVLLHWHRSLPEMPEGDEPLCILQLHLVGQTGQGQELEFLEARLQKHHLQPPLAAWSTTQLQRLMAVMAEQRRGAPPNHDEVRLRRAPGRLVIDVHFRSQIYGDGGAGISLSGCVVEILNAYSSGRSARSDTLEVLRAVAAAQSLHTKAIAESRVSMEGLQSEMDRLEGDWTKACASAKKRHRGLLQRFALVLQAKIDKERALHEELQVRRWNQQGAAAAAAAPKPAAVEEPLEVRGRGRRGRGGGGRRGRGRGAAVLEGERPRSPRGDKRPWDEVDDAPGSPAGRAAGTLPAGTVTQGLMMPPPTVTSGMPPTMSLFDPPSDEEPVPARDLTAAAPAAAPPQPEEPALPKGPPRPAGVSTTDDLFFSALFSVEPNLRTPICANTLHTSARLSLKTVSHTFFQADQAYRIFFADARSMNQMWIAMQDLMQVALVVACVFAGWSLQTSACSFLLQRMTYPLKKTVDFTTDHDGSDSTEERWLMANLGILKNLQCEYGTLVRIQVKGNQGTFGTLEASSQLLWNLVTFNKVFVQDEDIPQGLKILEQYGAFGAAPGLRSGSASLRTRAAKICLAVAISWGSGLPFAGSSGRCQPRGNRSGAGRAAEDTMGELFTKYYRLQEVNRNLEADTKVAVVSELLEVLDDLERGASQDGGTGGVSTLRSLADKFQSRLESLGFERIKALGAVFDPAEHEAASQRAAEGQAEGTVCEELRSGWKLSDRIVRPSVVIVAS
ncbi:grpE [Symbiodinium sp. CCMP2456]|nr:grpE [Symbiodinium sp. CCMP2456]